MTTFQDRFKGKTTIMGKNGLNSVIDTCQQPIQKENNYQNVQQNVQRMQQQVPPQQYQQNTYQWEDRQTQPRQQQQQIQQQEYNPYLVFNPYQTEDLNYYNPIQEYQNKQYRSDHNFDNKGNQKQQQNQNNLRSYSARKENNQQRQQIAVTQQSVDSRSIQEGETYAHKKTSSTTPNGYRPYTLREYEQMKKTANTKLGGLGPNTNTEEWQKEKEKSIKRQEFAEQVRSFNNTHVSTQPQTRKDKNSSDKTTNRQKALEFAKNIPKPPPPMVKKQQDNKVALQNTEHDIIDQYEQQHLRYLEQIDKLKY